MKKLPYIILFTLFAMLSSCDDKGQNFDHSHVIGSYLMTEWNAPVPIDFNQDGESSRNLMEESSCYDGSMLTIRDDGTFTKTYKYLHIENGTIICETENRYGTWSRTGDRLTLTWDIETGQMSDSYNYGEVNDILTRTIEDTHYPSFDENGQPVYETGHVNLVFSKLEQNPS